jgi:hypothetical protein
MKRSVFFFSLMIILISVNACKKDGKGIYSSGQVTIRSTWACDLDRGVEATTYAQEDFEWGNKPPHYLEPVNGAKFYLVGTVNLDSLEYDTLTSYAYSANNIWVNLLPVGTVVAGITKNHRYCKFRIDANSLDLTITWVTYEL